MAAGFVHGVLNSDNINVTGESFDYGPWRFTPDWDPDFTAAYFDHYGLYSFGRQPEAIHWDLAQFAGCMSLVAEAPPLSDNARRLVGPVRGRIGRKRCSGGSVSSAVQAATATWRQHCSGRFSPAKRRSIGSSSTGAAAAIRERSAIRPNRSARSPIALKGRQRQSPMPIGRTRSPARCTSKKSRRSGRRSPIVTIGQPFEAKVEAIRRMGEAMADGAPPLDRSQRNMVSRAPMAEKLVSTEPSTGAELWSGEVGDAAAEVAAARAAWPEWAAHSLAYRIETLRRFANVVRKRD